MHHHVKTIAATVTLLAATAAPVWAQTPPPSPPPPTTPTPGIQTPPPSATPATNTVEGKVKSVDPVARTISVSSGWLGFLFGKTLEVGPDTHIMVGGKDSSLAAVREGAQVKASYETRDGKMLATRIEVVSSQDVSSLQ